MHAVTRRVEATTEGASRVGEWALGRWRLEQLLGSGGMSTVYGAVHRTNGKRVAVKVLHPHLARVREAVDRFLGEGAVANSVDHPGVCSVFDDGAMEDGALCLVMDKLVGGSLDQWLSRRGPLPVLETVLLLDGLLDVLAAAHRVGVVHRDVKPDNVFITTSGAVKLLDFGIARSFESAPRTEAGSIMGTPAYMPPEQAEGRWGDVDARADVFAVGAVALALLTGEAPRSGATPNLTLLSAMSRPLKGVRERGLEVPPAVADVIDRAIRWRREDRHPTAGAMQKALRTAWVTSCRVALDGHDRHLAPVGRLLAEPPRESGVVARLDPDSTDAMPTAPCTIVDFVAAEPPPVTVLTTPTASVDWLSRMLAALRALWPQSARPLAPELVIIGLAASMALALLFGIVVAQMFP